MNLRIGRIIISKNKTLKIVSNTIVIFFAVIAVLLIMSNFSIFGLRALSVKSGSMNPAIKTGSLIFTHPLDDYQVDDIITYRSQGEKELITHRIIQISRLDNQISYRTQGDANDSPDSYLVPKRGVAGKVFLSMPILGYIISFAKTTLGIILLVVIPATIIIYEEICKIKKEYKKIKKKKILGEKTEPITKEESDKKVTSRKEKIFNILKRKYKIFLLLLTITVGLIIAPSTYAITKDSGDLTIKYPEEPIFNEINIAPGYFASKSFSVTNNADSEKFLGIKFRSGSAQQLDEVLHFSIQKNNKTIFGGSNDKKTLSNLVSKNEISIDTLRAEEDTNYSITAELLPSIGNEYQGKTSIFDMQVEFFQTDTPPAPRTLGDETDTQEYDLPPILVQPVPEPEQKGLVLGEETTQEQKQPQLNGNILGVDIELPITGNSINFYLILISIVLTIGILLSIAAWRKTSPENDLDDELEQDEEIIEI
ncbi:signal peptidase I [Patescibacteria group bacterium]|nr:signal peptidase I [Patescibacteria group bacterium]